MVSLVRPVKTCERADAPPDTVTHEPEPIRACHPVGAAPVPDGVQDTVKVLLVTAKESRGASAPRAAVVTLAVSVVPVPPAFNPRTLRT